MFLFSIANTEKRQAFAKDENKSPPIEAVEDMR